MSLYTLRHLLNDCSTRMTRTKAAADKKRETLEEVWCAFNGWIESRFSVGKGVHIATFATITWETVTNSRNQPRLRPVFIPSDSLIRTYGLQQKKALVPPVLASLEDINFTKIAIKFSKNLTKDVVFSGIRELLQKFGEVCGTGRAVSIAFNFGKLIAKNRTISMVFDPSKFPSHLETQMTRSVLGTPPSELGNLADFDLSPEDSVDFETQEEVATTATNGGCEIIFQMDGQEAFPTQRSHPENLIGLELSLEEELSMFNLKTSPVKESPVIESAYKRHFSSLADEVAREAKYSLDLQLQQKRDLENLDLEKKNRRQHAEEMHNHIKEQMEKSRVIKEMEKNEQKFIDPSASSFYSISEQSRKGKDDKEYIRQSKQDLKYQLQEQINQKIQERMNLRQKNLSHDKIFLRQLKNEMEEMEEKQIEEKKEKRKQLTEAWKRDKILKQLVEEKTKQKINELIHRNDPSNHVTINSAVPTTTSTTNFSPHSPKPKTPTTPIHHLQDASSYSVGFDIRSVMKS